MNYLQEIGISFLVRIPYLLAWLVAIVFAVIMLRRGGGKAEKLLLAGCSLMFFNQLVMPFLGGLARWMVYEQEKPIAALGYIVSLPTAILSMAGIICLIYAFWVKFKARNSVVRKSVNQE